MVIIFLGLYDKLYCVYLNAELFNCTDGSLLLWDTKHFFGAYHQCPAGFSKGIIFTISDVL